MEVPARAMHDAPAREKSETTSDRLGSSAMQHHAIIQTLHFARSSGLERHTPTMALQFRAGARLRLLPGGRGLVVSAFQQGGKAAGSAPGAVGQEPSRVLKASLDVMLSRYMARTPSAGRVVQRVYEQGYGADQAFHDHFAFRTFGVPGLGVESLGAALEAHGYTRQDWYTFPRKHLLAAWYAPPRELYEALPRVFVSQLQVEKLSPAAQAIIASYTDSLPASPLSAMLGAWGSALTGALPWRQPSRADYQALLGESEYGAWVLVNGWALNHTALSVHQIAGHSGDVYRFADELVAKGFTLNEEGGRMKVSPDAGLLQCSTVADVVDFTFSDGQVHPVVGAYMEFVERKPLPQHAHLEGTGQLREHHRRDGFETDSADNIFASTSLAAQQQGLL